MTHTHISTIEHPPGIHNRAVYGITDTSCHLKGVTINGITHNRFTFIMKHGREWLERLEDQVWEWWEAEGRHEHAVCERDMQIQEQDYRWRPGV